MELGGGQPIQQLRWLLRVATALEQQHDEGDVLPYPKVRAKIKGMFVRPEQVAALVDKHDEILKARVVASRSGEMDVMTVRIEADGGDEITFARSVVDLLKRRGTVDIVAPGTLPKDGLVIEDQRSYD